MDQLKEIFATFIEDSDQGYDKTLAAELNKLAPGVERDYKNYLARPDVHREANRRQHGRELIKIWSDRAGKQATPSFMKKILEGMDSPKRKLIEAIDSLIKSEEVQPGQSGGNSQSSVNPQVLPPVFEFKSSPLPLSEVIKEEMKKTGTHPNPNLQQKGNTCAAYALGNAILDGIDKKFDCENYEEEIIKRLIKIFPNMEKDGIDPKDFDGKEIQEVKLTDKTDKKGKQWKAKIKINVNEIVTNYKGPVFQEGLEAPEDMLLALDWGPPGETGHAVYAKEYFKGKSEDKFHCVNSWGPDSKKKEPILECSKIMRIFDVSGEVKCTSLC